jgi:hypothetical protein
LKNPNVLTKKLCCVTIPQNKKGGSMAEAYCVKCKSKKEIKDAKEVSMKNGRKAMKGKCPDCGTGMYRIMGK